jgi:VWFA-related protein
MRKIGAIGLSVVIVASSFTSVFARAQQERDPHRTPASTDSEHVIELSAVVQDKKGNYVTNLSRRDFTVLEDGRPRPIESLIGPNDWPAPRTAKALPPDTYSNRLDSSGGVAPNVTVILFDAREMDAQDLSAAREQLIQLLRGREPTDRLGVYILGDTLQVIQDFTSQPTDLNLAIRQIDEYIKQSSAQPAESTSKPSQGRLLPLVQSPKGQEAWREYLEMEHGYLGNLIRDEWSAQRQLANRLAGVSGRKNIVWMGLPPRSVSPTSWPTAAFLALGTTGPDTVGADLAMYENGMSRSLGDVGVSIYPVGSKRIVVSESESVYSGDGSNGQSNVGYFETVAKIADHEGLGTIARNTGGIATSSVRDLPEALKAASEDSRSAYAISFVGQARDKAARPHIVKVLVNQANLRVRARTVVNSMPTDQPKELRQYLLAETASSEIDATGISMTVEMRDSGSSTVRKFLAKIRFDPRELHLERTDRGWAGNIDTVLLQLDAAGNSVEIDDKTEHLEFKTENPEYLPSSDTSCSSCTREITLSPKAAQLCVLVQDSRTGTVGTVHIPLSKYLPAS